MIYSVACNQYLAETYFIALQISDEAVKHCMFKGQNGSLKLISLSWQYRVKLSFYVKSGCWQELLQTMVTPNDPTIPAWKVVGQLKVY